MPEVSTKSIDHLGLVAGMIEELEIKQTIEEHLPSKSEEKKITENNKKIILKKYDDIVLVVNVIYIRYR